MNIDLIQKEFGKADEQLEQAITDLERMSTFLNQFEQIQENIQKLEAFYFKSDFTQKLKLLEDHDLANRFWSAGQDSIWNVSAEYRSLLVELLKCISDNIYDNTLKFNRE